MLEDIIERYYKSIAELIITAKVFKNTGVPIPSDYDFEKAQKKRFEGIVKLRNELNHLRKYRVLKGMHPEFVLITEPMYINIEGEKSKSIECVLLNGKGYCYLAPKKRFLKEFSYGNI